MDCPFGLADLSPNRQQHGRSALGRFEAQHLREDSIAEDDPSCQSRRKWGDSVSGLMQSTAPTVPNSWATGRGGNSEEGCVGGEVKVYPFYRWGMCQPELSELL